MVTFLKRIRELLSSINLRLRLTGLFVALFGGILVLFAVFSFRFISASSEKSFDDALYNYAVDVFDKVSLGPTGDLEVEPPFFDREKIYPFALGTALIQIRHASGKVLSQLGEFGQFEFPFRQDYEKILAGAEFNFRTVTKIEGLPNQEASSYRMLTVPLDNSKQPHLFLQIAVPRTLIEAQLAARLRLFETLIPISLLIATLAGYFLSTRALRPVRHMIDETQKISAQDLAYRLPIPKAKDEIRDLALTVNAMLDRIDRAFQSQERFIADASHQLLTPLTSLRAEIESNMRNPTTDVQAGLLQEVDHLSRLVKDLLLLARVESGEGALSFREFDLDEVVTESIARVEKLAKDKNISFAFNINTNSCDRPRTLAERELIGILVFNLLENAAKYSSKNSQVQVNLQWHQDRQHLCIEDFGPGIQQQDAEKIFDRFHRASNATSPGHGLGLAIAQKIAEVHGARLWAENKNSQNENIRGALFHFEINNF